MTTYRLLLPLLLFALRVGSQAQPIASEPQTREWTQKSPPGALAVTNSDKYVDYKRDGKVVFRAVERTAIWTAKPDQQVAKNTLHLIEFVADGKVMASVVLDGASALSWTVISDTPVYFTSGFAKGPEWRFFHVCMPAHDYYEYLEVSGTKVRLIPEQPGSYDASKKGFVKMTERGFLHQLGREQLLDQEKPQR